MNEKTENMQDLSDENIENVAGGRKISSQDGDRKVFENICKNCGKKFKYSMRIFNQLYVEQMQGMLCPDCLLKFDEILRKY